MAAAAAAAAAAAVIMAVVAVVMVALTNETPPDVCNSDESCTGSRATSSVGWSSVMSR